jgi:hypothetical protein
MSASQDNTKIQQLEKSVNELKAMLVRKDQSLQAKDKGYQEVI